MSLPIPSRKQVFAVFVSILAIQVSGFAILGNGRSGSLFFNFLEIVANLLAIGCSLAASRRGRGVARLFWLLFACAFALQLVAEAGWTFCRYFNVEVPDAALFPSLFYRLYAVPMAISLFLSADRRASKLETFLEGCVVVGLVGLVMYQVQMTELNPHDSNMWRLITTTAVVNVVLVLAASARFACSAPGQVRGLFGRLTFYLSVYSSIAFLTSCVDTYFPAIDSSFDLIWILTYLTAASLAIRWRPPDGPEMPGTPRISRRASLLCFNLSMATMVLGSAILGLRVVDASRTVGLVAVGLVLFSYAIRCALMQDAQEKYVAALQESNTRYKCVALATNDVLWDRNMGDGIVSWNENLYSLFGYEPEQVGSSRDWWVNQVHPEDREEMLSSVAETLRSGRNSWSGEYRFRKANGSYAYIFDRGYVVRDARGEPIRIIGSMQDLSVRKQAEIEIQQAHRTAEEAARTKSDFLSNMSHEIRTPLNGILGMLELARQTRLNPEQEELLNMAGESATALLSVVNDVLDFSKIEAGKMDLEKTSIDIADTVAEAARIVLVRAHQKNLELAYHVDADVPRRLAGDPIRLKQVLMNLLGNAVKFTERGEILLDVKTEVRRAGEIVLRFSVSDTGIGIPLDKQKTIFQAFSQADNSVTRRFGGTGLGLAICAKIVNLMRGKIWVESGPGQGSTFAFTAVFEPDRSHQACEEPADAGWLRGMRALIVDAHSASRTLPEEILASWGARTVAVGSAVEGAEALRRAASEGDPFRLLLLDHHMPDGDNLAILDQAKKCPGPLPGIIMTMTSDGYQGTVARLHKLGIAGHLIKPFKRSELLSAIGNVLPEYGNNNLEYKDPGFSATSAMAKPPAEAAGRASRRLHILLAEDNPVNQKLAVKMLEKMGHMVSVAENGLEALEKAKTQSADLVLMDGHMPQMDGLAATRAIREWESPRGLHVPIIALTAMTMKSDEEACRRAGMDAFIAKPISMKALQETIQKVMEAAAALPASS